MTFRKRRRSTPFFPTHTPYNPIEGGYADLQQEGLYPYCAMMQVVEEDTHDNYVVCRGIDPRFRKFMGNISVAKPYGKRGAQEEGDEKKYKVGEIYPAFLPTQSVESFVSPVPRDVPWRVGQTPGFCPDSEDSGGHPGNLTDAVEILKDDDDKVINWLLIDSRGGGDSPATKMLHLPGTGFAFVDPQNATLPEGGSVSVYDAAGYSLTGGFTSGGSGGNVYLHIPNSKKMSTRLAVLGTPEGVATKGGIERPLYLAEQPELQFEAKALGSSIVLPTTTSFSAAIVEHGAIVSVRNYKQVIQGQFEGSLHLIPPGTPFTIRFDHKAESWLLTSRMPYMLMASASVNGVVAAMDQDVPLAGVRPMGWGGAMLPSTWPVPDSAKNVFNFRAFPQSPSYLTRCVVAYAPLRVASAAGTWGTSPNDVFAYEWILWWLNPSSSETTWDLEYNNFTLRKARIGQVLWSAQNQADTPPWEVFLQSEGCSP